MTPENNAIVLCSCLVFVHINSRITGAKTGSLVDGSLPADCRRRSASGHEQEVPNRFQTVI